MFPQIAARAKLVDRRLLTLRDMPGQIHPVVKNSKDFNGSRLQKSEHQEMAGLAFVPCGMQCKNARPDFFSRLYSDCLLTFFTQGVNGQR
jgi:hypothetical protein